jgi:hypothetical protein
LNVIDTLSEGFGAANRRLWIVAIPVLFDLFLWLGPKATVGPHLASLVQSGVPAQYSGYEALVQQSVAGFNLFSLAALYLPSLVVRLDGTPLASLTANLPVNSPGVFLLAAAGIVLAGLWLGCLYMGLIAQVVRDGQTNLRVLASAVWRYWRRLVALLLMVAGLLLLAAVPFGLVYVVLASASPAAGDVLAFVLQIGLLWALVFLFFAVQALLLSDVGPVHAMRLSVAVTAGNFWAAVFLISLTFLISLGVPLAWQLIAFNPAGLALGIIGNAYIGTGVAAAAFLFYQERLARLKPAAAPVQESQ